MLINIERVTKSWAPHQTPAVNEVSLGIPAGSVFGLLGPNGAGKTTLISMLVGLHRPDAGSIAFDGRPLASNLKYVRAVTGFVPQDLAFYPMLSVAENLAFYSAAMGTPKGARAGRIEQALAVTRLEDHIRKTAWTLSGGLKRRLNLAIGLLNNPRVLFLDEPTVGIDPQSRNFILAAIGKLNREQGMTVIYTSHYMEEVQQICDHVAIIDDGRIVVTGKLPALLDTGEDRRVEVRVRNAIDPALSQWLQSRYDVRIVDTHCFLIATDDHEKLLSALPAALRQQGAEPVAIRYGQASLEELYMSHTSSLPRD